MPTNWSIIIAVGTDVRDRTQSSDQFVMQTLANGRYMAAAVSVARYFCSRLLGSDQSVMTVRIVPRFDPVT